LDPTQSTRSSTSEDMSVATAARKISIAVDAPRRVIQLLSI
jgi:hypothetical protein